MAQKKNCIVTALCPTGIRTKAPTAVSAAKSAVSSRRLILFFSLDIGNLNKISLRNGEYYLRADRNRFVLNVLCADSSFTVILVLNIFRFNNKAFFSEFPGNIIKGFAHIIDYVNHLLFSVNGNINRVALECVCIFIRQLTDNLILGD